MSVIKENLLPSISVVCPSYNSAQFIAKTLLSVIEQTSKPFELIVSDDGSSDDTCQVVEALFSKYPTIKTKLIKNTHKGPGAARNRGIEAATGEWVAFLDSDDIWKSNKLERVVYYIKQPEFSAVNFLCHREEHVLLNDEREIFAFDHWCKDRQRLAVSLYYRNFFHTSAVVCKKKLIELCGKFDEKLMSAQDYELWLRMAPEIRLEFVPEVLGAYYDRKGNITSGCSFKRYLNSTKVLWKHRDKAGFPMFFLQSVKVGLSLLKRSIIEKLTPGIKGV